MTQSGAYIVRCSACMAKNRILEQKSDHQGKCGKCGTALRTKDLFSGRSIMVTDKNFEDTVLKSPLPFLLDIWAPWCGPCQMVTPIVDGLAREWKGRISIGKLNMDQNSITVTRYQILSVPSLLLFDRGELKENITGAVPKQHIVSKVTPYFF